MLMLKSLLNIVDDILQMDTLQEVVEGGMHVVDDCLLLLVLKNQSEGLLPGMVLKVLSKPVGTGP